MAAAYGPTARPVFANATADWPVKGIDARMMLFMVLQIVGLLWTMILPPRTTGLPEVSRR